MTDSYPSTLARQLRREIARKDAALERLLDTLGEAQRLAREALSPPRPTDDDLVGG
jgi:hypothetical protein